MRLPSRTEAGERTGYKMSASKHPIVKVVRIDTGEVLDVVIQGGNMVFRPEDLDLPKTSFLFGLPRGYLYNGQLEQSFALYDPVREKEAAIPRMLIRNLEEHKRDVEKALLALYAPALEEKEKP